MDKCESISCVEAIQRLVGYRAQMGSPISSTELTDVMIALFGKNEHEESVTFLCRIKKLVWTGEHYELRS